MRPDVEPAHPGGPALGTSRELRSKLVVFILLSAAFGGVGALTPLRHVWNSGGCAAWVRGLGVWGPLAILAAGALAPLALLPRWPLAVGCGMLYGLAWGGLLANAASTLGAWLQFFLARRALGPAATRLLARRGRRFAGMRPRQAAALLVALRVFPLSSFVATNLLAASINLSSRLYVLATFAGMIPSTLMYGAWGRLALHPTAGALWMTAGLLLLLGSVAWLARGRLMSADSPAGGGEDRKPFVV